MTQDSGPIPCYQSGIPSPAQCFQCAGNQAEPCMVQPKMPVPLVAKRVKLGMIAILGDSSQTDWQPQDQSRVKGQQISPIPSPSRVMSPLCMAPPKKDAPNWELIQGPEQVVGEGCLMPSARGNHRMDMDLVNDGVNHVRRRDSWMFRPCGRGPLDLASLMCRASFFPPPRRLAEWGGRHEALENSTRFPKMGCT